MNYFNQHIVVPKKLIEHYTLLGINEAELVILMKLLMLEHSEVPSFETLAEGTTLNENQLAALIQGLIQKDLLDISVNQNAAQYQENFSLEKLDNQLGQLSEQQDNSTVDNFKTLFVRFENQFGRPLTPIEMQTLTQWMDTDHHTVELINAALDEAAAHNKLSFKYIDRILLNWQKRNVRTIDDSKVVREEYKQPKMKKTIEKFPVFDWVNGDNPYDK